MNLDYFIRQKNTLILLFTILYVLIFSISALFTENDEFFYYTLLMGVLIYIVLVINQRMHFAPFIVINLSLIGFLHLLGGNAYIGTVRLYDFYFVPGLIKYDNLIHVYGTFIVTLVLYSMVSVYLNRELIRNRCWVIAVALVLMAIGVGTINELVEFFAVVYFDAAEQVGDYFNNSLDLLFNTIGAIMATVILYWFREQTSWLHNLNENLKKIS